MDETTYRNEARMRDKQSAEMERAASRGARTSSGTGVSSFGNALDTSSPKRRAPRPNADPWSPAAPSTADEMGGALDTGGPAKSYGLDYMGHFANDDVMEKGHNTGAPSQYRGKVCG